MKPGKMREAISCLNREEQDLLMQVEHVTGQDSVTVVMDMEIRHGLTDTLGQMGNAVQHLLSMLDSYGLVLPKQKLPDYDTLLHGIACAAEQGTMWVKKSQDFDRAAFLALTPEHSAWVQ